MTWGAITPAPSAQRTTRDPSRTFVCVEQISQMWEEIFGDHVSNSSSRAHVGARWWFASSRRARRPQRRSSRLIVAGPHAWHGDGKRPARTIHCRACCPSFGPCASRCRRVRGSGVGEDAVARPDADLRPWPRGGFGVAAFRLPNRRHRRTGHRADLSVLGCRIGRAGCSTSSTPAHLTCRRSIFGTRLGTTVF